jgi:hypothetical protein
MIKNKPKKKEDDNIIYIFNENKTIDPHVCHLSTKSTFIKGEYIASQRITKTTYICHICNNINQETYYGDLINALSSIEKYYDVKYPSNKNNI